MRYSGLMAAFLVIAGAESATRVLDDARRDAVIRAMHERSGGAVTELEVSGARGWHCGRDGTLAAHDNVLVAVDGVPSIISSRAANGIPPRFAPADWRRFGKDLLPALDGGFALAAFDSASRELVLARDRFGVRPLFWARKDGLTYAASEVKILAAAGIELRVSAEALREVLACRWLVRDRSLFDAVRQVPAASCLVSGPGVEPSIRRYWQLQFTPEPVGPDALHRCRDEARDAMRSAILEISGERQVVGVLLSGGVDSSVIAGAAREVVGRVVGFAGRLPGDSNQELDRALFVARQLGIECRVVDIQLPDFDGDLRTLARRMEEPPRHPNNFLLQQLFHRAAGEVDLVLEGDGAEMLFGLADVARVDKFRAKHDVVRHLPQAWRVAAARALRHFDGSWATRLSKVLTWSPTEYAAMLDAVGYSRAVRRTLEASMSGSSPGFLPLEYFSRSDDFSDALQVYQLYTFAAVSLVRHDRLAQPFGLSSESPFLRAPMIDLACRMPRELRYLDGSKPVLKAVCDLYLPAEVSRWPKLGFPVPWQAWIRDALPRGVAASPVLDQVLPRGWLAAANASNDAEALWTALTLQAAILEMGAAVSAAPPKRGPN